MTIHAPWRGMRTAFVTGSYAYGTPHPKSDVDLVVPSNAVLGYELADLLDEWPANSYDEGVGQLSHGDLNLIFVSSQEWQAWWDATVQLIEERPVTRERAKEVVQVKLDDNCQCRTCTGDDPAMEHVIDEFVERIDRNLKCQLTRMGEREWLHIFNELKGKLGKGATDAE